jgi:magnesium chelatase family protein
MSMAKTRFTFRATIALAPDPQRMCTCSAQQIQRYNACVSGPLFDRIDLHIDVPPVSYTDLAAPADGETSAVIRARVNAARQRQ